MTNKNSSTSCMKTQLSILDLLENPQESQKTTFSLPDCFLIQKEKKASEELKYKKRKEKKGKNNKIKRLFNLEFDIKNFQDQDFNVVNSQTDENENEKKKDKKAINRGKWSKEEH